MTRYAFPLVLLAVLTLAGCAGGGGGGGVPVSGRSHSGDETFQGEAIRGIGTSGSMSVKSSRGAVCDGRYAYQNFRNGEGTISCSDGRSGSLTFVADGDKGTGTGTLGGQPVTFTIGK